MSFGSFLKIPCNLLEVKLDFVLACGQSFRWTKDPCGDWTGVIGKNVFKLRQTKDHIEYQVNLQNSLMNNSDLTEPVKKKRRDNAKGKESSNSEIIDHETILKRYFSLEISLVPLYESWSAADERFCTLAGNFHGIRILQQDFVETLFSFICSSNNNIQRIQQMVEKLCINYGSPICELDGRTYYSFPGINWLARAEVEGELRKLGFGYRAKFVQKSAKFIDEHPLWLETVIKADYVTAKSLLMELPGVGAKVADCVCLMALGHHGSVPVDTHVFAVTAAHYLPKLRGIKSVTPKVYNEIGEFYRERFGAMAGWAHSVLFTADLARFKEKKTRSKEK